MSAHTSVWISFTKPSTESCRQTFDRPPLAPVMVMYAVKSPPVDQPEMSETMLTRPPDVYAAFPPMPTVSAGSLNHLKVRAVGGTHVSKGIGVRIADNAGYLYLVPCHQIVGRRTGNNNGRGIRRAGNATPERANGCMGPGLLNHDRAIGGAARMH